MYLFQDNKAAVI